MREFLQNTAVAGIVGENLQDILRYFATTNCISFPFGGAVRDMFLGITPKDLDMETACSIDDFYDQCKEEWGPRVCKQNRMHNMVHVGEYSNIQEPIDVANYQKNFFDDHSFLEYTANSLGFDSNANDVVIDVTGHGVSDTCDKVIRIPVHRRRWEEWLRNNKPTVVFRYWKLRQKGFKP